jgi:hypothetical protein
MVRISAARGSIVVHQGRQGTDSGSQRHPTHLKPFTPSILEFDDTLRRSEQFVNGLLLAMPSNRIYDSFIDLDDTLRRGEQLVPGLIPTVPSKRIYTSSIGFT